MSRSFPSVVFVLVALPLVACGEFASEPDLAPAGVNLQIISGNAQTGPPGEELPEPLVVRAVDNQGRPLNRIVVNFVPTVGGGSAWGGAANTDPQGYALEYWTLGPLPGENRIEARVVDPRNGDKLMLGEFVAEGVWTTPPAPETCDGVDNDQDGEIDEYLAYCFDGTPAPNSDGVVCDEGYLDLNGVREDGCETVKIDGRYYLTPTPRTECDMGEAGLIPTRVDAIDLTQLSGTEVRVSVPILFTVDGVEWEVTLDFAGDYDTTSGVLSVAYTNYNHFPEMYPSAGWFAEYVGGTLGMTAFPFLDGWQGDFYLGVEYRLRDLHAGTLDGSCSMFEDPVIF